MTRVANLVLAVLLHATLPQLASCQRTRQRLGKAFHEEEHENESNELIQLGETPSYGDNVLHSFINPVVDEEGFLRNDQTSIGPSEVINDSIIFSETYHEDDIYRRRAQAKEFTIKNTCSERLKIIVRYKRGNKFRVLKKALRPNISLRLPRASSKTFYLYATGAKGKKVVQGNGWCLQKKCLKQLSGFGTYSISCKANDAPQPAPTPNPPPTPTPPIKSGDKAWLDAHNKRRLKYHDQMLKWSSFLAKSAQSWADELISKSGCQLYHDKSNKYGENLAANTGQVPATAENVLKRWTEDEKNKPFGENLHRSQVLWKYTKYVGCGEASKPGCHVQACRYAAPGNCNIDAKTLETKMLEDTSLCGPHCPPDFPNCV